MASSDSPQAQLIAGALCENLHRLLFYPPYGMSAESCEAAAKKAIETAQAQIGADAVEEALSGVHAQLRDKISGLKA